MNTVKRFARGAHPGVGAVLLGVQRVAALHHPAAVRQAEGLGAGLAQITKRKFVLEQLRTGQRQLVASPLFEPQRLKVVVRILKLGVESVEDKLGLTLWVSRFRCCMLRTVGMMANLPW